MNAHRTIIVFAAAMSLAVAACSSNPQRFEEKPKETSTESNETTHKLGGEGRAIPELQELEFVETPPAAVSRASAGDTQSFQIGGMTVIHKRTPGNPVVQARLYIKGGTANLTEETAGIEQLAMKVAVTGGTESTPKDTFNARLDSTGSAVFSFNDKEYSGYGLKTLVDYFPESWQLFTESVLEPAMPTDEVDVRRTKQLASIASMLESPDSQVSYEVGQNMYVGHPFRNLQIGTKENVESLQRDELLAYQRAMLAPGNMTVVVVGDVDTVDLLEKIRASFGRLRNRPVAPIVFPEFTSEPGVEFFKRELPTHYVLGLFPGPAPGTNDYPAMLVALDYLRERLFEEVRTKRNLTYAVSSGISDHATNYGFLYVTAADVPTTLRVMFAEVDTLRKVQIEPVKLEQTKNVFITDYYMDLQTNGSQASQLARAHIVGGDWRKAETRLADIRAVTPVDIQRVAQTYLKDYRFAVVGPDDSLSPALFSGPAE